MEVKVGQRWRNKLYGYVAQVIGPDATPNYWQLDAIDPRPSDFTIWVGTPKAINEFFDFVSDPYGSSVDYVEWSAPTLEQEVTSLKADLALVTAQLRQLNEDFGLLLKAVQYQHDVIGYLLAELRERTNERA